MIHRDVEKSLQLLGMEIHREHTMHAGGNENIGHELGRDRNARLILAILAGVSKEGNHSGNSVGTGAAGGINHDEQLHDVLIGRRTGRLDDKDITSANIVVDFDKGLPIRKGSHRGIPQRLLEIGGYVASELAVRGTAEDPEFGKAFHGRFRGYSLPLPRRTKEMGNDGDFSIRQFALGLGGNVSPLRFEIPLFKDLPTDHQQSDVDCGQQGIVLDHLLPRDGIFKNVNPNSHLCGEKPVLIACKKWNGF